MKSSSKLKILISFVIISTCIQYSLTQDYPGVDDYPGDYSEGSLMCAEPDYSGDGICDDQNNNADCDFDGGDCCGPHVDKTFCIKCECLENNQESDENFLDFFRSLSHVPQYHPEPEYSPETTIAPPSQNFLAEQFLLQQGLTYPPSTNSTTSTTHSTYPPHSTYATETPNPHEYYPQPTKTCPGHPICNGHGNCLDGVCHCLHGHTGDGCEIPPTDPTNPCHDNPICNGHGSCSQGATVCNCLHGYTGNGCEIPPIDPPNPCHSDPICNGHGSCSYGGTICHCLHGYTGDGCEVPPTGPPNPCHSDPICNGHGSCSQGGTVCDCLHGYTGDGCEIPPTGPPNPCHDNPICNGHGSCSQGGTVCDCLHGYTGDGCEIPPITHITYPPKPTKNPDYDPHSNQTHCVDVSTYTYPEWVKESRNCCSTEFVKKTHKKWKEVCMNVTSLYCDVWPHTECKMKMHPVTLNTTTWKYVYFPVKECVPTYKKVVHMKKKPVCIKKPKYHCSSKWKMLPSGEKVWDGYEDCTVIYWDDCKLVDYNETIKVETPYCRVHHKIPYMTIVKKTKEEMVYKMECHVKQKTHCTPKTTYHCATIDYTETEEVPVKTCPDRYVKEPRQYPEHKTKCLFMKDDYIKKTQLTIAHGSSPGGSLF